MDKEGGGLKNWSMFMDVMCVSSLRNKGFPIEFLNLCQMEPDLSMYKMIIQISMASSGGILVNKVIKCLDYTYITCNPVDNFLFPK